MTRVRKEEAFFSQEKVMEEREERKGFIFSNEYHCKNHDEEKKRLSIMRTTLVNQDPACKEIDDLTLRRFLRARDLDVDKASAMFMKYLTWRRSFVPKGSVSASEIPNEIAQNKTFKQGTDKKGHPIGIIFGGRHFPYKGNTEEFKRFVVFGLDKLCSRMPEGQEKFTIIADLEGYCYGNTDIRGVMGALSVLQDYYPERLAKLFIIHAPYLFMAAWKVIYPFIDKNTKKKITFVENKKLQQCLLEEIDESQLPEIYGGKMQLVPIHEA